MFYAEFGVFHYTTCRSHHLVLLMHLYEQWTNGQFIRRVSFDRVVWC